MKISDTFTTLFGKKATIESDDIRLTKEMLDLSRMEHDDIIWIPLKLKLDDLSKKDGAFPFVTNANELTIEQTDENVCWCDDGDFDKSFVSLGFDIMALANGIKYGSFRGNPIFSIITIVPFSRTPVEMKVEIDHAKRCDEIINLEAVEEYGCKPIYYSDEVKERVEDEQHWFETHNDREGHDSYWSVKVTPEEFEEIRKLLNSIPEIKKITDGYDAACTVVAS